MYLKTWRSKYTSRYFNGWHEICFQNKCILNRSLWSENGQCWYEHHKSLITLDNNLFRLFLGLYQIICFNRQHFWLFGRAQIQFSFGHRLLWRKLFAGSLDPASILLRPQLLSSTFLKLKIIDIFPESCPIIRVTDSIIKQAVDTFISNTQMESHSRKVD